MEKFKSWLSVVLLAVVTGVMLLTLRPVAAPTLQDATITVGDGFVGAPISADSLWIVNQVQTVDGEPSLVIERHLFSNPGPIAQTIKVVHGK